MHVLIIAQLYPPDMGGGATRAQNAAIGLKRAGCDVTVITAFPHYPHGNIPSNYRRKLYVTYLQNDIRVIRTYVPGLASEGFAKRAILFLSFIISSLTTLLSIRNVDIIWAANPNVIVMLPGMVFRFIKRCPLVQNVDDLWPEALYDLGISTSSIFAKIGEFLARLTYKTASALTPISPAYVDVLVNKYQLKLDNIMIVPAGVDLQCFKKGYTQRRKKGSFRVLYIGAFSPAYNFDQVFDAAKELEPYNDIEFIVQGGGELAEKLILKSKKMNLRNLRVINEIVSRNEVARILSEADVLLLPLCGIGSIEMGISSKLYEYQAAARPILSCSSGQPGKYVSDTNSGLVIPPGDYEALAQAILYLYQNPEKARTLGNAGRKNVENSLSLEMIGKQMKKLFQRLT